MPRRGFMSSMLFQIYFLYALSMPTRQKHEVDIKKQRLYYFISLIEPPGLLEIVPQIAVSPREMPISRNAFIIFAFVEHHHFRDIYSYDAINMVKYRHHIMHLEIMVLTMGRREGTPLEGHTSRLDKTIRFLSPSRCEMPKFISFGDERI